MIDRRLLRINRTEAKEVKMGRADSHHREAQADRTDQEICRASHHREAQADSRVQETHKASHHREAQADSRVQEAHREAQVSKMD